MNHKYRQQGQAIVEMCICLIAIMAVFLGMVFAGGLGISNIQTLLRNKSATEALSRSTDQGGAGSDIYAWDYGDQANASPAADEFQGHRLFNPSSRRDELAFTADDKLIANASQTEAAFQNPFALMNLMLKTEFSEENRLRTIAGDSSNSLYFLGAANLVTSQGTTDNTVYTLRRMETKTADSMKDAASALFGLKSNFNLQNISNQVYYPATGSGGN